MNPHPDADRLRMLFQTIRRCRQGRPVEARAQALRAMFGQVAHYRQSLGPPSPQPTPRGVNLPAFQGLLQRLPAAVAAERNSGRSVNVWEVAGLKRGEVRTTRVLGWVLDCQGSHGLGDQVLRALLDQLGRRPGNEVLQQLDLGPRYRLRLEYCGLGIRNDRIDLAIEGRNCLIFVEVKIDAPLGPDQLKRYLEAARHYAAVKGRQHACVLYLSRRPWHGSNPDMVALNWQDVAQAIRRVVNRQPPRFADELLLQFAHHVNSLH